MFHILLPISSRASGKDFGKRWLGFHNFSYDLDEHASFFQLLGIETLRHASRGVTKGAGDLEKQKHHVSRTLGKGTQVFQTSNENIPGQWTYRRKPKEKSVVRTNRQTATSPLLNSCTHTLT